MNSKAHLVHQEHYLKGIQDPAIVVNHHRVSLLTLEAWGTLEGEGGRRGRFQGGAPLAGEVVVVSVCHPRNPGTGATRSPGPQLSCNLGAQRGWSSGLVPWHSLHWHPGSLTKHCRSQAGAWRTRGPRPTEEQAPPDLGWQHVVFLWERRPTEAQP